MPPSLLQLTAVHLARPTGPVAGQTGIHRTLLINRQHIGILKPLRKKRFFLLSHCIDLFQTLARSCSYFSLTATSIYYEVTGTAGRLLDSRVVSVHHLVRFFKKLGE